MKFFIVLLAVVAAVSAGYVGGHGGYGGGHGGGYGGGYGGVETYHVANVFAGSAGGAAVSAPHNRAIAYKGNEHTTRLHYNGANAGHPHLVGVEHYVAAAEPAIGVVKAHGHGGHGW